MTIPGRMFGGVKFFKSKNQYTSKKAADEAAKWWRGEGFSVHVLKSIEKFKGKNQYAIYTRDTRSKGR